MGKVKEILLAIYFTFIGILAIGSLVVCFFGNELKTFNPTTSVSAEEEDSFKMRQFTLMSSTTGEVLLQISGNMDMHIDSDNNQIEIIIKDENGSCKNKYIGLTNDVTYIIDDLITSTNT